MIAIEEVERRILSELQEAGEENIAAMLNTIIEPAENAGQLEQLQQRSKIWCERTLPE